MNTIRGGVVAGLLLTAAASAWWLGASYRSLAEASDTRLAADQALQGLLLAEVLLVAAATAATAAHVGARRATHALVGFAASPAPLGVLLWSAGTSRAPGILFAVVLLVGSGIALALVGVGLRRTHVARPLAAVLGAALAGLAWRSRAEWLAWFG